MRAKASPDRILKDMDFIVRELLEAPAIERPAMLEKIAKALTRRLLQNNPEVDIREVSESVGAFVDAVQTRINGL
jgi:hypothetical protein